MTDPKRPSWLPDEATMTQMANALFKALPQGGGSAMPGTMGMTSMPELPAMQSTASMPSMPSMPGMPAVPGATAMPAMPGLPAQAMDARQWTAGTMPSFYFLQPSQMGLPADWDPTELTQQAIGMNVPTMDAGAMQPQRLSQIALNPGAGVPDLSRLGVVPELIPMVDASRDFFDVQSVRRQFPILGERVHGRELVWLDNAATTQKPQVVIDRLSHFYAHENSNIHRAAHALAARATDAYEAARESVRRFLNAGSAKEIVFVRGTTEAINLVAQSWGRRHIGKDDEIVLTWLEHHSNIVPWQMLAAEKGAKIKVAPVDDKGNIILEQYERLLGPKTKLVSITHVSNALGTVMPVKEMTQLAHRHGAKVLIDGAQAVSHLPVNVADIDCDWYALSGHKIFAPTGIGVLRGKPDVLEASPPWQGGGNMIQDVTFEKTAYHPAPMRFEAGTGNIADAVGLGTALDWLSAIGMQNVWRHEHGLLEYGTKLLNDVPGLRMIGQAAEKAGVLSFVIDGLKTEEIGSALDQAGIAVRAGHHCAQPALRRYGVESSVRASLAPYNTTQDLDALAAALHALTSGRGMR
jgi:cysteine desulfurase / selenocysteine lyase